MKTLSQLKEGDILYEYDLNKKFLNILYVTELDHFAERIHYKPLVVSDLAEYGEDEESCGICIWFPNNYDLEQPILVHYYDNVWSIFCLDYNALEKLIKDEELIKDEGLDINGKFETALNMFEQEEILLFDNHIYIEPF